MSLLVVGSVALDSVETPFGKRDDVLAFGFHLLGLCVDGQSQRGRERSRAARDVIIHKSAADE